MAHLRRVGPTTHSPKTEQERCSAGIVHFNVIIGRSSGNGHENALMRFDTALSRGGRQRCKFTPPGKNGHQSESGGRLMLVATFQTPRSG